MKIELYTPLSIHEIGKRSNQEDSLWPNKINATDKLFLVCDGMGGHEKGEVASQTVCQALGEWFSKSVKHPFSKEQVYDALAFAYKELDKLDSGELKKMGTTLTLLYLDNNGVTAAHVGDSRIYHVRPNSGTSDDILFQSRDHSLVFDLFQTGEISYNEMAVHPQKNVITRAITPGEDNRTQPDVIHITDIKPGDYFYMCSDGMLEQMSNDELATLLATGASDEKKRQQLIAATVDNHDNHTAWLLHVKSVVLEQNDTIIVNEELTARFNAMNIIRQRQAEEKNIVSVGDDEDVVLVAPPKPEFIKETPEKIKSHAVFTSKTNRINPVKFFNVSIRKQQRWCVSSVILKIVIIIGIIIGLAVAGTRYVFRSRSNPIEKPMKVVTEKANQFMRNNDDSKSTENIEEQSEEPHEQENTPIYNEIKP